MNVENVSDTNDLLSRWNTFAENNGGQEKAIGLLPESEREVLFDFTNRVQMAPFILSKEDLSAFASLKERLQSVSPNKSHTNVASIQKAILQNNEFAKVALRDRLIQAESTLAMHEKSSPWGKVHVSRNTLLIMLESLVQRAKLFAPEIRDPFLAKITGSKVYSQLKNENTSDVTPLILEVKSLLITLESSLS